MSLPLSPPVSRDQLTDTFPPSAANASRTLENYKAAAAKANTVVPGGVAGAGGSTGSTTSGGSSTTTGGSTTATPSGSGAGVLTAPGTVALIAAAGFALLL